MIDTFFGWILSFVSGRIGERKKQRKESEQLQDIMKREIIKEVKNDLLDCINEMNMQFKDFEELREKGIHNNCDEFIMLCHQYIKNHFFHSPCYKKLELDIPDDGGLDEILHIIQREKFYLDITSKNFMSDVYFQTLDDDMKMNILEKFRIMSFEYSALLSKYDSIYLKKVLNSYKIYPERI